MRIGPLSGSIRTGWRGGKATVLLLRLSTRPNDGRLGLYRFSIETANAIQSEGLSESNAAIDGIRRPGVYSFVGGDKMS